MPIYVYETVGTPEAETTTFEFEQRMSDPAFDRHPETGVPIRRILAPPSISGGVSKRASSKRRSSDEVAAHKGFTKYVNQGNGVYEKAYGSGPRTIRR